MLKNVFILFLTFITYAHCQDLPKQFGIHNFSELLAGQHLGRVAFSSLEYKTKLWLQRRDNCFVTFEKNIPLYRVCYQNSGLKNQGPLVTISSIKKLEETTGAYYTLSQNGKKYTEDVKNLIDFNAKAIYQIQVNQYLIVVVDPIRKTLTQIHYDITGIFINAYLYSNETGSNYVFSYLDSAEKLTEINSIEKVDQWKRIYNRANETLLCEKSSAQDHQRVILKNGEEKGVPIIKVDFEKNGRFEVLSIENSYQIELTDIDCEFSTLFAQQIINAYELSEISLGKRKNISEMIKEYLKLVRHNDVSLGKPVSHQEPEAEAEEIDPDFIRGLILKNEEQVLQLLHERNKANFTFIEELEQAKANIDQARNDVNLGVWVRTGGVAVASLGLIRILGRNKQVIKKWLLVKDSVISNWLVSGVTTGLGITGITFGDNMRLIAQSRLGDLSLEMEQVIRDLKDSNNKYLETQDKLDQKIIELQQRRDSYVEYLREIEES